ncbi:P-loop containing nucleoside triphosphate hydrolase protein [Fistulina hepatica ATCC 64428]|uniref:RNA helicase n=1 Tax=Fistulina hepatica ATCC 64428 TaxID=1128425 RepID=A0A0D7ABL6_9AGAR|nr:P-loop containing nucleoside triphosphate hydrolase protein [Fistulina hepatica ATCC 64428]
MPAQGPHVSRYRSALDQAQQNKHSIVIEGECDFGVLTAEISIVDFAFVPHRGGPRYYARSPFSVSLANQNHNRLLVCNGKGGQFPSLILKVHFRQRFLGTYQDRLEVTFEDQTLNRRLVIARVLNAVVGDTQDHEQFGARSVYRPRRRVPRQPETNVVPRPRMPMHDEAVKRYSIPLPFAPIPRYLENILSGGSNDEVVRRMKGRFECFSQPPSLPSYTEYFRLLLWSEEHKMRCTSLAVPGLAEKRPRFLVGDIILVQKVGALPGDWFSGRVNVVRKEDVGLSFHPSFSRRTQGQQYNARFKLNRLPLRRQHQAFDMTFDDDRILFPTNEHAPKDISGGNSRLRFKNALICQNERQLLSVTSIVHLSEGSLPLIVFGPPGTGKTAIIVEAMVQILSGPTEKTRVLACAPSNSAADLIAMRLKEALPPRVSIFRYYAASRNRDSVPKELQDCTCMENGQFSCPPPSVLAAIGVRRGHYTHIFVDEVGQATESEVMVPICTMAHVDTNVVLAGNPKQLGPVIRSSVAQQLGFEQSMIERLMKLRVYQLPDGLGRPIVKLTKNFRSHNSILKYPTERFYGNELLPCAERLKIDRYLNWPHLPNREFPIIFHAVSGQDAREASSPSFFTVHEMSQVKRYVQSLLAKPNKDGDFRTGGFMIQIPRLDMYTQFNFAAEGKDIGVITPYLVQCVKIHTALRYIGANDVKVGTVEEFQGQERPVIIISTVRSSREFIRYDLKYTLGFVANPRRFNVSIARAQALLITVDDPHVLQLDALWRKFLSYVHNNNGWTGAAIPWDLTEPVDETRAYDKDIVEAAGTEMEHLMRQLEEISIITKVVDETEEDDDAAAGANVDLL